MLHRILYRKDPQLHAFYVDFENRKLYKCYREDKGQSRYDYEVECYKKMEGSKYIPKIYGFYKKSDLLVIEMEFIPRLPFFEHIGICKGELWKKMCYTKEQVARIHEHIDGLGKDISERLMDSEGNIEFTFSNFHLIYDEVKDRLTLFDLAGGSRVKRNWKSLIEGSHYQLNKIIPVGEKSTLYKCTQGEIFRELMFPRMPWSKGFDEELYSDGAKLIYDIVDYKTVHPLYINGKNLGGNDIFDLGIKFNELSGRTVIDNDCGLGEVLCYYVERGAKKVYGIIKNDNQFRLAKRYIEYMKGVHPMFGCIEIVEGIFGMGYADYFSNGKMRQ